MKIFMRYCIASMVALVLGLGLSCGSTSGSWEGKGTIAEKSIKGFGDDEVRREGDDKVIRTTDKSADTEAGKKTPEKPDWRGSKGKGDPSKQDVAAADIPAVPVDKFGKDKSRADRAGGGIAERSSGPSGLKAGFADDNRQYNYFIDFISKYGAKARHIPIDVSERIVLKVMDGKGKPVNNAGVKMYGGGKLLAEGLTYSDGSFLFFPSEYGKSISTFKAVVEYNQTENALELARSGKRDVAISLSGPRHIPARVSLDILFILDTTGSMGEEIERLKRTIELIYLNLSSIPGRPLVRFGMVLYKDRRDEYVTRIVPLTEDLEEFQAALSEVEAGGGGDYPEDLQSALEDAVRRIEWNPGGIRLCFIITDAPPHLDYGQQYTYREAVKEARERGIKIFSVGTGGLTLDGEFVLRQISQYTAAKYIFLTYGEKGESEGGREGSVSHHTGANFQTDKLESIIIRFARDELGNALEGRLPDWDEHFSAKKVDYEKNEETLRKLFGKAASQLVDYSSLSIAKNSTASLIPLEAAEPDLKRTAEYFSEQLSFSLIQGGTFKMVERGKIQGIMKELELTMTGLTDQENAAKVGKLLGAQLLITGKLYRKKEKYELFLRLLRVETAEVLSVTKARLDFDLGLEGQRSVKSPEKKVKRKEGQKPGRKAGKKRR